MKAQIVSETTVIFLTPNLLCILSIIFFACIKLIQMKLYKVTQEFRSFVWRNKKNTKRINFETKSHSLEQKKQHIRQRKFLNMISHVVP